eukprot:scaffold1414_cov384-Prasinococcus_capsulatus_cf.AAC.14
MLAPGRVRATHMANSTRLHNLESLASPQSLGSHGRPSTCAEEMRSPVDRRLQCPASHPSPAERPGAPRGLLGYSVPCPAGGGSHSRSDRRTQAARISGRTPASDGRWRGRRSPGGVQGRSVRLLNRWGPPPRQGMHLRSWRSTRPRAWSGCVR